MVGILLSKVEITQIICRSMSTRPRRASAPVRASMNEINYSTTQKCEMRDALTEYDWVIGMSLSQLEIAQNICESISTRPRRARALA